MNNISQQPSSSPNPNSLSASVVAPVAQALPSFDQVCDLFVLPLSEAASTSGVCTTVLRKVCRDNGLERWPYRQFLAGKTIDEIKKEAAIEKNKQPANFGNTGGLVTTGAVSQTLGSERAGFGISYTMQQQTTKNFQSARVPVPTSTSTPQVMLMADEFRFGFPSTGLSAVSYKWWGSSNSDDQDGISKLKVVSDAKELKPESKESEKEVNPPESDKDVISDPPLPNSLSAIRKRTVEEGREALKLDVWKRNTTQKLSRKQKKLLLKIFGSSLPSEWLDISST